MIDFVIKRIYEPADADDGVRVLVDRLWPRGVAKRDAQFDLWMKEVSPSPALRTWFAHDPTKWSEFQKRYAGELADRRGPVSKLRSLAGQGRVTLLYAARDEKHNHAIVLRQFLVESTGASSEQAAI